MRLLLILPLLLLALLTGCASYPGGVDEETWKQLPPEKRAELMRLHEIQQAKLEEQRLKLSHEEARRKAELERERLRTWRELYQHSREGAFVRINFISGEGHFYKYRPIVPDSVTLAIGEAQTVTLRDRDGDTLKLWLRYLPGKIWLCNKPVEAFDPRQCAVVLDLHWDRGQSAQLNVPNSWDRKHPRVRNLRLYVRTLGSRQCD